MNTLTSEIIKASLQEGMARRRIFLVAFSVLGAIGWPVLIIVAMNARPMETYALVVLSGVALLSILMVPAWFFIDVKHFYRLATFMIATYMTVTVLQTANVMFGSTADLYLAGNPPLMIASHQILILMAFVFLDHQTARKACWVYGGTLAAVFLLHTSLNFDEFTSHYAFGMMLISVMVIVPASILFMRIYIELHLGALASAQASVARSETALVQLAEQNLTDTVTGARNREGLKESLSELMQEQQVFGLLVFKLQNQEDLRERLGDKFYEELLVNSVNLLADWTGNRQQVGRREGSELLVWSTQLQNQDAVAQTGEELLKQLDDMLRATLDAAPELTRNQASASVQFRVAGSVRAGHLDSNFLLEEVMFRLFMAKLRPNRICFEA